MDATTNEINKISAEIARKDAETIKCKVAEMEKMAEELGRGKNI